MVYAGIPGPGFDRRDQILNHEGELPAIVELNKLTAKIEEENEDKDSILQSLQTREKQVQEAKRKMKRLLKQLLNVKNIAANLQAELGKYSMLHTLLEKKTDNIPSHIQTTNPQWERAISIANCINAASPFHEILHPTHHSEYMFRVYSNSYNQICGGSIESLDPKLILLRNVAEELMNRISSSDISYMYSTFKTSGLDKDMLDPLITLSMFQKQFSNLIYRISNSITNQIEKKLNLVENYRLYITWMLTLGYVPLKRNENIFYLKNATRNNCCECTNRKRNKFLRDILFKKSMETVISIVSDYAVQVANQFCYCKLPYFNQVLPPNQCMIYKSDISDNSLAVRELNNPTDSENCFVYVIQSIALSCPNVTPCGKVSHAYSHRKYIEELHKIASLESCRPRILIGKRGVPRLDPNKLIGQVSDNPKIAQLENSEKVLREKNEAQLEAIKELKLELKEAHNNNKKTEESMNMLHNALESENSIGEGILKEMVPLILSDISGDRKGTIDRLKLTMETLNDRTSISNSVTKRATLNLTGNVGDNGNNSSAGKGGHLTQRLYMADKASEMTSESHLEATHTKYNDKQQEIINEEMGRVDMLMDYARNINPTNKSFLNLKKQTELMLENEANKEWGHRIITLTKTLDRTRHYMDFMNRLLSTHGRALCSKDEELSHLSQENQELSGLLNEYDRMLQSLLKTELQQSLSNTTGDEEDKKNKKNTLEQIKTDLKKVEEALSQEWKNVEGLQTELSNTCKSAHHNTIYQTTNIFNAGGNDMISDPDSFQRHFKELPIPNSYNEPMILKLNDHLGENDDVVASKLAIDNIPDVRNLQNLEEELWKDIVMNKYKFGSKTNYYNVMVKLSPRYETNLMIMEPYFRIIYPREEIDTGLIAEDNATNPLSLSKLIIIKMVIDNSIAGSIISAKKKHLELRLQKEESEAMKRESYADKNSHNIIDHGHYGDDSLDDEL